jgi:hypothetical protein
VHEALVALAAICFPELYSHTSIVVVVVVVAILKSEQILIPVATSRNAVLCCVGYNLLS